MMTPEDFLLKFEQERQPYWTIYHGRPGTKRSIAARNTTVENFAESFEMLQQQLGWLGDGVFSIVTKSSPNAKDNFMVTVQIGSGESMLGSAKGRPMAMGGMQTFMQMWTFMQSQQTAQIEAVRREMQLKHEIDRLSEALEAPAGTPMEIAQIKIAENADRLVDGIMGFLSPTKTPAPSTHLGAATSETAGDPPKQGQQEQVGIDMNASFNALMIIQQLYPQYQVGDMLMRLAQFMQTDKGTADYFVQQLYADAES